MTKAIASQDIISQAPTSNFRRYPDVVVHRLLAAALDAEANGLTEAQAVEKHRLFNAELCSKVT
jgi:DIS3-like exonuclease 2